MLYPKEDLDSHKLQFTCRTCQYTEEATSTCVFRNLMNNAVGETAGVTQDVGSDPTVSSPSPAASMPIALQAGRVPGPPSGEYTGEYLTVSAPSNIPGPRVNPDLRTMKLPDNGGHEPLFHIVERDVAGIIRSVVATSIYNCLEPEDQAGLDHIYVRNLISDTPFSLHPSWSPAYLQDSMLQDEDADPPEALGEEPHDTGIELML